MPYIVDHLRKPLDHGCVGAVTPGELNYQFTKLIVNYIRENGLNYQHINDVIGALEGAKIEFYERVVVVYENMKKVENGDVGYDEIMSEWFKTLHDM